MTGKDDQENSAQTTRNFQPIDADFFRFEKVGDKVEGTLVESRAMVIRGNDAMRYKLRLDGGAMVALHGSAEIDDKLTEVQNGQYVRITYTGETPTSGGFNVKQYKVEVAQ